MYREDNPRFKSELCKVKKKQKKKPTVCSLKRHIHATQLALGNEKQPYKSAGVVVPQSLGVAKGLQQRVGLQDDVFDVLQGNRGDELLAASLAGCKRGSQSTLHTDTQPALDLFPTRLDILSQLLRFWLGYR